MTLDEDTVRLVKGKNLATVVALMPAEPGSRLKVARGPGSRPVGRTRRPVRAGVVSAGCPAR
jgi:hypothetical protein